MNKNFLEKSFDYIKKGIKFIFNDIKRAIIIILLIVISLLSIKYCTTKNKLEEKEAELIEKVDTLTTYKNRAKELYIMKETYIADNKTLKSLNDSLYKELKNLKDHPITIVKTNTIVKIDSIKVKDSIYVAGPDTYIAKFNFNDKHYNINGESTFNFAESTSFTTINNVLIPANFTTDLIEKKGNLYFITKCDNPYVKINNIEGVVLSPEQSSVISKRYNKPWAVVVGVGPSVTVVDNTVKILPALHLTVGFKIIDFKL